jgi:hypothetical protein
MNRNGENGSGKPVVGSSGPSVSAEKSVVPITHTSRSR